MMEISIKLSSIPPRCPLLPCHDRRFHRFGGRGNVSASKSHAFPANASVFGCSSAQMRSSSTQDLQRRKSPLESLVCSDKSIPEEAIEKPVGLSLSRKDIGNNPPCIDCQAKGAVLCATCSGSGLYVDSILESQGIIVKVRCLGCGGSGNVMCSACGGRGHSGIG